MIFEIPSTNVLIVDPSRIKGVEYSCLDARLANKLIVYAQRRKCTRKGNRAGRNFLDLHPLHPPPLTIFFERQDSRVTIGFTYTSAYHRHYLHPMITINSHSEKPPSGACTVSLCFTFRSSDASRHVTAITAQFVGTYTTV